MSFFDGFPVLSQIKSAYQAVTGDLEGAKKTQENFIRQAPVVSQINSAVVAISGNTEEARKIQEDFLHKTVEKLPVVSQAISAGYAISGNSEMAKRIQIDFLNENIKSLQEFYTSPLFKQSAKLSSSEKLTDRRNWMGMEKVRNKRISELLIPGTHDSTTYKFENLAGLTAFAKTQCLSIAEQLNGGVRYLDIRIYPELVNGKVFCSHTFLTVPFSEVCSEIAKFLEQNTTEIIFIALQKDGDKQYEIYKNVREDLEKYLIKYQANDIRVGQEADPTIDQLSKSKKRAIVIMDHKCAGLNINNSWDQTQDASPIVAHARCTQWARGQRRTPGQMNLLAMQATMSGEMLSVLKTVVHEISSWGQGLEALAGYSNFLILYHFIDKKELYGNANIINMDFANDKIIGEIIKRQ